MVVELEKMAEEEAEREKAGVLRTKSEVQKTDYVWMDGEIVPWDEATVPVMSHALHYGTGVFEGIRGYAVDGNLLIFRLKDHMERLGRSAKICDIDSPNTAGELSQACIELLRANKLKEDCYIRPIVFVGFSGINLSFLGYPTSSAIIAFPFKHYFSKPGLDVCVSSWTRLYDPVTPTVAKICGNYVNSVFAKREAGKNGFDEAIMLNSAGKVSEGTGENIFLVRRGKLHTPSLGSSILDGITRDSVMQIARRAGYEIVERDVSRGELYVSDELFLTGTAAGIAPVLSVDKKKIGNGGVGPVTRELAEAFTQVVTGKSDDTAFSREWITRVY